MGRDRDYRRLGALCVRARACAKHSSASAAAGLSQPRDPSERVFIKAADAISSMVCGKITNILGAVTDRLIGPVAWFDVPTRPSGAKFTPPIGYFSPSDCPSTAPKGNNDTAQSLG